MTSMWYSQKTAGKMAEVSKNKTKQNKRFSRPDLKQTNCFKV